MSNTSLGESSIDTAVSNIGDSQMNTLKKNGFINKLKSMIGGSSFSNYKLFRNDKKSKYIAIVLVLLAVIGGGLYIYMKRYIQLKMDENKGKQEEEKEKKEEKKQDNLIKRVKEQIVKM